jgi:hypothetical protein
VQTLPTQGPGSSGSSSGMKGTHVSLQGKGMQYQGKQRCCIRATCSTCCTHNGHLWKVHRLQTVFALQFLPGRVHQLQLHVLPAPAKINTACCTHLQG